MPTQSNIYNLPNPSTIKILRRSVPKIKKNFKLDMGNGNILKLKSDDLISFISIIKSENMRVLSISKIIGLLNTQLEGYGKDKVRIESKVIKNDKEQNYIWTIKIEEILRFIRDQKINNLLK